MPQSETSPSHTPSIKQPAECTTKDELRVEIDRIDQDLLKLFAERHGYVTRMAELKSSLEEVQAPERIEQVISRLRGMATELDMNSDQAETIWRTLIEWNIAYEKGIIAARNGEKEA